jgi:hypothetical protein
MAGLHSCRGQPLRDMKIPSYDVLIDTPFHTHMYTTHPPGQVPSSLGVDSILPTICRSLLITKRQR